MDHNLTTSQDIVVAIYLYTIECIISHLVSLNLTIPVEAVVKCVTLNCMTQLGMPESVRTGG